MGLANELRFQMRDVTSSRAQNSFFGPGLNDGSAAAAPVHRPAINAIKVESGNCIHNFLQLLYLGDQILQNFFRIAEKHGSFFSKEEFIFNSCITGFHATLINDHHFCFFYFKNRHAIDW